MFTIADICEWTGGKLAAGEKTQGFASVSIDTRTLLPGALYVAIKGEIHDGHSFIDEAIKKGATGCLVEGGRYAGKSNAAVIEVADTLKALQDMAAAYRKTLDIPIVAVTGSNGKTLTKNFMAAVLQKKFNVAYTKGNLNNHIGLPLSILSIKSDDEIAVFEIGTNHPGEVAALAKICQPTAAVITNIGTAHIENFHSKEAIAKEKGSLVASLPEGGFFVVPVDDEFTEALSSMTKAKVIKISDADAASGVIAAEMRKIRAMPEHIIKDATLAAAVGREYGILGTDILDALLHVKNEDGRFTLKQVGIYGVIDDTYNANPDSVCAAIEAMGKFYPDRRKIVALGKLMEQGDFLNEGYERIISAAKKANFGKIIFVGISYEDEAVMHVRDQQECAEVIKGMHQASDIVLLKGSKSAEMGKVIDHLAK